MAWVAKVSRHVTLVKVSGGTVKLKPGVITAIATDSNPVIRVGRHDTSGTAGIQYETYGNGTTGVSRRTDVNEDITVTKYISY